MASKPIVPEQAALEKQELRPEQPAESYTPKRSYEPKLNKEQYLLLIECIEEIKLFRHKVKISELKSLLNGKLKEPLQVANQPSLVFLFDQMMQNGYIKKAWMSVAVNNGDFISFKRGKNVDRYGKEPHYLTMSQMTSRRDDNKYNYVVGQEAIEEMIKQMDKLWEN